MDLNPRQQEAVRECRGPVLVIAGPGTGKTRVITEKVIHLVERERFSPSQILALTFTQKAAAEMEDRALARLGERRIQGQPFIGTFHGFCLDLVEAHAGRLGLRSPLRLLTGPLYVQFLMDHLDSLPVEHTYLPGRVLDFCMSLAEFVSLCHDENLIGQDLAARADQWLETLDRKDRESALEVRDLAAALPRLLDIQYRLGVVAYGDLLSLAVRLLRENADVLEDLRRQFQYVLVDELQDNNLSQFQLINTLAEPHGRILVVGDEDQSIYRFRGAGLGLLRQFEEHWRRRGLKTIHLEENYRSSPPIVETFQTLIRNNANNRAGILRPTRRPNLFEPAQVTLYSFETDDQERRYVVRRIQEWVGAPERRPGDIAILCRSLTHVRELMDDLRRAGVPVEVIGGGGMFAGRATRDILAWLKFLGNPMAETAAWLRVLQFPSSGLEHVDVHALMKAARAADLPPLAAVEKLLRDELEIPDLRPPARARLQAFLAVARRFRQETAAESRPDLTGLLRDLLDFTGLGRSLQPETARGRAELGSLAGLLGAARAYEEHYPSPSLSGFLRYLDLVERVGLDETAQAMSEDDRTVKIMTIHQAKGREFPVVVVTGLLDRFPTTFRRDWRRKFLDYLTETVDEARALHREEERRLLYVALSRAQQELLLTLSRTRGGRPVDGKDSFVADLEQAPSLRREERAAEEVAGHAPAAACTTTREFLEARLHHLISRLGIESHGGSVRSYLEETLGLIRALLAEHHAPDEVDRAFQELGLTAAPPGPSPALERLPGPSGPLRLSPTSLRQYEECPRQYYYEHVARIPPARTFAADYGVAVHKALEEFHRRHARTRPEDLEELLELFRAHVAAVDYQSEIERRQGLALRERILRQYVQEESERCEDIARIEVEKELSIRAFPGIIIRCKLDRLDELADGRLRIVDYKARRQLDSRPQILRGFQIPTYAWAVRRHLGRELATAEVIGLGRLKRTARGDQLERWTFPWDDGSEYALTPQILGGVEERIQAIVAGIRGGEYPPAPDQDRCRWCSYRLLCKHAARTAES